MRFAAPQVLFGERAEGRRLLLPFDVVGEVPARADAPEHVAGSAAGLGKLAMPGDDDTPAPSLDAGLHDPDLPVRRVDAKAEAGQGTVEQNGVLAPGLLSRARRGVRSTLGMIGPYFVPFDPSG